MDSRAIQTVGAVAAAVALMAVPGAAEAGNNRKGERRAIDFACGMNDGSFSGAVVGDYATAISAIRVANGDSRVRARVVLTVPAPLRSDVVTARIRQGRARVLDCEDLLRGLFTFPEDLPEDGYFQGYLLLENTGELNVSVHYSAGGDGIASAQTETVKPVKIRMRRKRDGGVEICHIPPGNPDNEHTIEVGESAVSAHLAHGDYPGECDDDRNDD